MGWLEEDPAFEQPTWATPSQHWSAVEVRALDELPREVDQYLRELRGLYANGRAEFSWFELRGTPAFDWRIRRGRWNELDFLPQFLSHAVVRARWPDITRDARLDQMPSWAACDPLTLDGELARDLILGGAHGRFRGSAREAKDLGARVCHALFDDRFLEVEVAQIESAWSPWFGDVAWDCTWVILDRRLQRVALLASTDED